MDQKRDRANDPCMTNHTRRDPAQYLALLARRETERLTFGQLSEESGVPVATLPYCCLLYTSPSPRDRG